MYGRKVQFFYNDKDPQFYTEPHTEKAEPDAYQEMYEKKYLDHMDVLQDDGSKLFSVQLAYDILPAVTPGTGKMLLSSIVQKAATGKAFPGMKFTYHKEGGVLNGRIETITYPTGGFVTYTYSGQTLTRSNRERVINAPNGYGEPKVFIGEDYTAVIWRELGSNGSHDGSAKGLVLYVYTWDGSWKEQYIAELGTAQLTDGEPDFKDYKDFQVTVQKDFFAVLTHNSPNNLYNLSIVSRSQWNRSYWNDYTNYWNFDYGGGLPTLMSGTNFVAVGPNQEDGNHPGNIFTYTGDTWVRSPMNLAVGTYDYTGCNNYFIAQKRARFLSTGVELYFNYLTEDRKWVTKKLDNSLIYDNRAEGQSYWTSANNVAIVMAQNNPEYAYNWDYTYNTFFRNDRDINNQALFGQLNDAAPVFIMDNGLVGINGRIARFDGWDWHTDNITSTINFGAIPYYAYGDDFVVRPVSSIINTPNYRGGLKVYDPNKAQWQSDVIMAGNDAGQAFAQAGIDYYYFGNGYYYRRPDGVWEKKITYDISGGTIIPYSGYPRYDVLCGLSPFPVRRVIEFKSGNLKEYYNLGGRNLLLKSTKFKTRGTGNNTIASFPSYFGTLEDATVIYLNRLVNDDLSGSLVDWPVTKLSVYDGTQNNYTSFQYNTATALSDVSGNVAQYNEVTVVPGSQTPNYRPYGFTKTYFNNGLTSQETGNATIANFWLGIPYETQVYDNNGQLVSSVKTDYDIFTKNILNNNGTLVFNTHFVRPTSSVSMQDGIFSSTINQYDENTGFIRESTLNDYNSKQNQVKTNYKYFWEQYDPSRSLNILSPIIQTKKTITTSSGQAVTDVMAITWKNWNNVFATHKTYQWKKTGAPDFDFTNWSGTGEPSANWIKVSQVDAMDATGNLIQVSNR